MTSRVRYFLFSRAPLVQLNEDRYVSFLSQVARNFVSFLSINLTEKLLAPDVSPATRVSSMTRV